MDDAQALELLTDWYSRAEAEEWLQMQQISLQLLVEHYRPQMSLLLGPRTLVSADFELVHACANVKKSSVDGVVLNPDHLPFIANSFDFIVCSHWHECVQRPELLLAECSRVLAPEGVMVLLGTSSLALKRLHFSKVEYMQRRGILQSPVWARQMFSPARLIRMAEFWQLQRVYVRYIHTPMQHKYYFDMVSMLGPLQSMYKIVLKKQVLSISGALEAQSRLITGLGSY